jgi:hypothetical protein
VPSTEHAVANHADNTTGRPQLEPGSTASDVVNDEYAAEPHIEQPSSGSSPSASTLPTTNPDVLVPSQDDDDVPMDTDDPAITIDGLPVTVILAHTCDNRPCPHDLHCPVGRRPYCTMCERSDEDGSCQHLKDFQDGLDFEC